MSERKSGWHNIAWLLIGVAVVIGVFLIASDYISLADVRSRGGRGGRGGGGLLVIIGVLIAGVVAVGALVLWTLAAIERATRKRKRWISRHRRLSEAEAQRIAREFGIEDLLLPPAQTARPPVAAENSSAGRREGINPSVCQDRNAV
jgi:uncharacterized membrane protein